MYFSLMGIKLINNASIHIFLQESLPHRNFLSSLFMCKRIVYPLQQCAKRPGVSKGSWITNWPLTRSPGREGNPEMTAWNCVSPMTTAGRCLCYENQVHKVLGVKVQSS